MSTINEQAQAWLARQAAGPLSAAEEAQLTAWCDADPRHLGAYARAQVIEHAVSQPGVREALRGTLAGAVQAARARTAAPVQEPEPGAQEQGHAPRPPDAPAPGPAVRQVAAGGAGAANQRRYWLGGALAAGLALAAALVWRPTAPEQMMTVATRQGEVRQVTLADQSQATVNSDTRLDVAYDGHSRRIALRQGEAWFAVAKDRQRPFIVAAGGVQVRAVGTAFSVRLQGGSTDVVVTEGVVQVSRPGGQPLSLGAGQQARVPQGPGTPQVAAADADAARRSLAWREGKLMFKNDTLEQAAADFNRYNRRQIVIADASLRGKPLLGQYPIHAPEQFARDMSVVLNVPVSITAEQIRIGAASQRP